MKKSRFQPQIRSIFLYLIRWTLLVLPVALLAGSLVALFLWSLELVTNFRLRNQWLLFLLPGAGILIYLLYRLAGKNASAGNNLILEEIHQPGAGVPARMTPLILSTTLITHFFGGSAGREGTAIQMGGSMAAVLGRVLKLKNEDTRLLLMTGLAAGFGAVFGTPLTGAIFALEILLIKKIRLRSLFPCLLASLLANQVCLAYGIHHTDYQQLIQQNLMAGLSYFRLESWPVLISLIAGACFGLAARGFIQLQHLIKTQSKKLIPIPWLIPAAGGLIIILLVLMLGRTDYLGLGVYDPDPSRVTIQSSFQEGGADRFSWVWKILFTAITLGMGFKGGEVTPLFFIGASLGNCLAALSGTPVELLAGLGFIAVFAAATKTPFACTILGIELFGGAYTIYYALACFTAYYISGKRGIYDWNQFSVNGPRQ